MIPRSEISLVVVSPGTGVDAQFLPFLETTLCCFFEDQYSRTTSALVDQRQSNNSSRHPRPHASEDGNQILCRKLQSGSIQWESDLCSFRPDGVSCTVTPPGCSISRSAEVLVMIQSARPICPVYAGGDMGLSPETTGLPREVNEDEGDARWLVASAV